MGKIKRHKGNAHLIEKSYSKYSKAYVVERDGTLGTRIELVKALLPNRLATCRHPTRRTQHMQQKPVLHNANM